jgi:hypothetical protein
MTTDLTTRTTDLQLALGLDSEGIDHKPTRNSRGGDTAPVFDGNALSVAEKTFRLLITGPSPLAIDGEAIGHGLPARPVDLGELKERLLGRDASDAFKDAAWAELVFRARTDGPAWVIGCMGVAMPGLKNVAARVTRACPASLSEDIVSELVTEFVAQLARIDISRRNIAPRLLLWARKGALRARSRETRHVPVDPSDLAIASPAPATEPADLLADAVRQQIISASAAALIKATRLQGVPMADYASGGAAPAKTLYKQRERAEARLATALRDGQVSAISDDCLSKTGPCRGAS